MKLNSASLFSVLKLTYSLTYTHQLSLHGTVLLKYSSGLTEISDEAIVTQSILAFHLLS